MRIVRIALMLLVVMILVGAGTSGHSGQNVDGTRVNKTIPPCPPICPN